MNHTCDIVDSVNDVRGPEECHGGSADERAVGDLALVGEVLRGLDGRGHALDGEEGGEVGGVGGDHDQREEPPEGSNHSGGKGSEILLR